MDVSDTKIPACRTAPVLWKIEPDAQGEKEGHVYSVNIRKEDTPVLACEVYSLSCRAACSYSMAAERMTVSSV